MSTPSTITHRAQEIARHYAGVMTLEEAMIWSDAIERGFSAGFETSYLDNGRVVRVYGFAHSTAEAHADCLAKRRELVALGFKPTGSAEFNFSRFVPASIETTAPVAQTQRAA